MCFPRKLIKFLGTPFSTEHLWWLVLKPQKSFQFSWLFIMISFLFETFGFTNNPNFIRFKWKLKKSMRKKVERNVSIAILKFVEWRYVLKHLCYYSAKHFFFSPPNDVFIFLHTYVYSFYFLATLLQKEWRQNMFFFFLLIERDALN